jgi:hypothetical protein
MEMTSESIFIHSDPGDAKADKPRENETKMRRNRALTWKKGWKVTLWIYTS